VEAGVELGYENNDGNAAQQTGTFPKLIFH
jgi:hypothetical protein